MGDFNLHGITAPVDGGWGYFTAKELSGIRALFSCILIGRHGVMIRASHPEFVIPYKKYVKSISAPISAGTRFEMRIDMDDSPERRCNGVVGVCDMDPYKWSGSKWRCLMVRWDEVVRDNHDLVSPWEIDPSLSLPSLCIQSSPRLKKLRTGFPVSPANPVHVLYISMTFACGIWRTDNGEFRTLVQPISYRGILESERFPKVLQGQEICSLGSLAGKANFSPSVWLKPGLTSSYFNLYGPKPDFYPLASEGVRHMYFPYSEVYKSDRSMTVLPLKNNWMMENAAFSSPFQSDIIRGKVNKVSVKSVSTTLEEQKEGSANESSPNCKLFGFQLERESSVPNIDISGKRSCTKATRDCLVSQKDLIIYSSNSVMAGSDPEKLMAKADKMTKLSFTRWNVDWRNASGLYEQAAVAFRTANKLLSAYREEVVEEIKRIGGSSAVSHLDNVIIKLARKLPTGEACYQSRSQQGRRR